MYLIVQKNINPISGEKINVIAHVAKTYEELESIVLSKQNDYTVITSIIDYTELGEPIFRDNTITIEIISGHIPADEIIITDEEYLFVGTQWIKKSEALEPLKKLKLENINYEYNYRAELPKVGTPQVEVETWDIQKSEAEAWEKDNNSSTPFIDKLAESREMDRELLISKVLEKTIAYRDYIGTLTGIRQKLEDRIKAANNIDDLNLITWPQ